MLQRRQESPLEYGESFSALLATGSCVASASAEKSGDHDAIAISVSRLNTPPEPATVPGHAFAA